VAYLPSIRRIVCITEEVYEENGIKLKEPVKRVAAAAVIKNPYAEQYVEDLSALAEFSEDLGRILGKKAAELLGGPEAVESYGKGALVGESGELEHAAFLLHTKLANAFREQVGGKAVAKSVLPSAKAIGHMGASLDIPMHHKRALMVASHVDCRRIAIPDAPRRDEIVIALGVGKGGRPLARLPGLKANEIVGQDGLR
jgi:hypothetical protein